VFQKKGWRRSDLVVSTKIFWGGRGPNDRGLSRKHILEGTDASLARLRLDSVDLIFCHRPDLHTPVEETVRAMSHVIDQGKALYWGTSEWPAERILEAWHIARREHLVPPLMVPAGTRSTVEGYEWLRSRLEGAAVEGKIEKVRRLSPIAHELKCTLAQLAIAWCLTNPNVSTAITGASRPEQVAENMKAMEVLERLSPEVLARIDAIVDNRPDPEQETVDISSATAKATHPPC
jgi:aryl-alcohol dehydrogenase-like predicted oxidoreductase